MVDIIPGVTCELLCANDFMQITAFQKRHANHCVQTTV